MNHPRSYLFVPGHRPDRFAKAASSGADQIILDLEDAVGPDEKDIARQNVVHWFEQGGVGIVRINGADTSWFDADLAAMASCPNAVIMVPKADAQSVMQVALILPERPCIALIENVAGLVGIHEVAAAPSITRLAFGNLDFGADARIPGTGPVLDPARFQLTIASRHANLPPPVDGVTVALQDVDVLAADVARAKNIGFAAKLCIHPRQVAQVNTGFSPSAVEIDWAKNIVQAITDSAGAAVQVDGKMVDKPMLERARSILGDVDGEASFREGEA